MLARALLGIVALAGAVPCQDAAAVTEPGRDLTRPLDLFFGAERRGEVATQSAIVVLDPTVSLQTAGFADAFDAALRRHADALGATRLGLAVVGEDDVAVDPTLDHAAVAAAVRAKLARPSAEFQNIYATIRAAAAAVGNAPGTHKLLLVTLENGDAVDDLEATATYLRKAKAALSAITAEAYVADSYWLERPYQERPRGTTLQGGDAPVVDLPWGWTFQITVANEIAPAATAPYAISHLAAVSGGRVHLFTAPSQQGHTCGIYSACMFCTNDHLPQEEAYLDARVAPLTASTASRDDALRDLARDPWYRATVQAWKRAADEGLIRSQPPVRLRGTTASLDRPRPGRGIDFLSGLSFDRNAPNAERAAADAESIRATLAEQLAAVEAGQGSARQEASARHALLMLRLTRLNLLLYAAWCREIAPQALAAKDPPALPELPLVEPDRRPGGIGYSAMCLCHGVRPFFEVELPGGAVVRDELERFADEFDAFMQRYGHTQYGFAMHRAGIARFHFTYPGIATQIPRQRPKSDADVDGPNTPRPTRPTRGGASSGTPTGPQTGGGR